MVAGKNNTFTCIVCTQYTDMGIRVFYSFNNVARVLDSKN